MMKIVLLYLFSLIFIHHNFVSGIDLYISQTAICNNNCSGSSSSPKSDLNEALTLALLTLQQNLTERTVNIYFQGSYYIISNQSFIENSKLFADWEKTLSKNLTINILPQACQAKLLCDFYVKIFVKTQKISFSLTNTFNIYNIIFDWGDSLLNYNIYKNYTCYLDGIGCCTTKSSFNNLSSDCYVTPTIKRTSQPNNGFFDGTLSNEIYLNKVKFMNFYSILQDPYFFANFIKIGTNGNLSLKSTIFDSLYFQKSLIKLELNTNISIINSSFIDYNPSGIYEMISNIYLSVLIYTELGNSLIQINDSNFTNIQIAIFVQNNTLIVNDSSFMIRIATSYSLTYNENLGFFKLSDYGSLYMNNVTFRTLTFASTIGLSNKISVIALKNYNLMIFNETKFYDFVSKETRLIYGFSNNILVFDNFIMNNFSNDCFDNSAYCLYDFIALDSFNNVTITNALIANLQISYQTCVLSMGYSNNVNISNITISYIYYLQTSTAYIISFENSNKIMINIMNFLYYTIPMSGTAISFNSYNEIYINNAKFTTNPYVSSSSILALSTSDNLTFENTIFSNLTSYYPSLMGSLTNCIAIFKNCYISNVIAVYGSFFFISGSGNNLIFYSTYIVSLTAYLTAGLSEMLSLGNNLNFFNCTIGSTMSFSDAGFIALASGNNVTIDSTMLYFTKASTYAGFIESIESAVILISNFKVYAAQSTLNGGLFFLSQYNQIQINDSVIMSSSTSKGQGGVLYVFHQNQILLYKTSFISDSASSGGGVIFADNDNYVEITKCIGINIMSHSDGGFGFFKQYNIIYIKDCNFTGITAAFSGGFMVASKFNNIFLSNSNFNNVYSLKEGGVFVLNNNNNISLTNINILNVNASMGGVLKAFSYNYIIFSSIYVDSIKSVSQGGFMWLMAFNNITLINSNFSNINSYNGEGGLIYSYENNIIYYENNSIHNITSNPDGGFIYSENFNNLSIVSSVFFNCSASLHGSFVYLVANNVIFVKRINFTGYKTPYSTYMGTNNTMILLDNYWNFTKCSGTTYFLYSNFSNIVNISLDTIIIQESYKSLLLLELYYLSKTSVFNIKNSILSIDLCEHYFVVLSSSYLNINNFTLKNVMTTSNEIIDVESSQLDLSNVFLKNNQILQIIQAKASNLTFRNIYYKTNQSYSLFLLSYQSNLIINKGYFACLTEIFSSLLESYDSCIIMHKISVLGFISQNSGGVGLLYTSNLTITKSYFIYNEGKINGGAFSLEFISNNYFSVKLLNNIIISNKASMKGGFLNKYSNTSLISMILQRNAIILNKSYKGGVIYVENIKNMSITQNKILKNSVFSSDPLKPSKGGAIFLLNSSKFDDFSLNLYLNNNTIITNTADIGAVLYIEAFDISGFSSINNSLIDNKALYYGDEWASEINTIRFNSLERNLNNNPKPDHYFSAFINNIKSGYNYTNCLLSITGFDRFNSITYRTDEKIMNSLNMTQISSNPYSNSFTIAVKDGSLCFDGVFTRLQLPLNVDFKYQIMSSFPLSSIERYYYLTIRFQVCDIGDRLNDQLQCVPCSKGTYSFQADFTVYSDSCQLCSNENFYCFGGGNFTAKPGYWRIATDSYIFYRCPNSNACLGDPRNFSDETTNYLEVYAAGNCDIGYIGILCSECMEGYGYLDGHICSTCQNKEYYLQIFGNILIRLVFTVYLVNVSLNMCISLTTENPNKNRIIASNLLKIFTNHIQILGIIFGLPLSFPPELNLGLTYLLNVSPNVSEAFSIECVLKSINIDISLQYFKLMISGVYPFIILIFFLFFVKIMTKINSKIMSESQLGSHIAITVPGILQKKGLSYKDMIFTVYTLVALICYADIAKMTLSMFGCVKIGDGKYEKRLLFADFRINCDSNYHNLWIQQAAAPILIFFLFLYPFYIVISMYKHFNHNEEDKNFNFRFGYFFYAYKQKFFYWDFVILIRKLILIFMNSYFFSRVTDQVDFYPILLVIAIISIAFILQIYCKPFKNEDFYMINGLEEFSLMTSFYSVTVALLYIMTQDLAASTVFTLFSFMIIMNVLFFLLWLKKYYQFYGKEKLRNFFKKMKIKNASIKPNKTIKNIKSMKVQQINLKDKSPVKTTEIANMKSSDSSIFVQKSH